MHGSRDAQPKAAGLPILAESRERLHDFDVHGNQSLDHTIQSAFDIGRRKVHYRVPFVGHLPELS